MNSELLRKIDENAHKQYLLKCNIYSLEDDLKKATDAYEIEIIMAKKEVYEEQLRTVSDLGNCLIYQEQEAAGYWGY